MKRFKVFLLIVICAFTAFAENDRKPDGTEIIVSVTCYQPVSGQCAGNPLITSDGSRIDLNRLKRGELRWCAVSPDIHAMLKGRKKKRIWIEGFGVFEIHDTTSKRFRKRVDILLHPSDKRRYSLKGVRAVLLK